MLSVLFITPYCPNPVRIRTSTILKALGELAEVDLLYFDDGAVTDISRIRLNSIQRVQGPIGLKRFLRILIAFIRGTPVSYSFYADGSEFARFRDEKQYDLVWVERLPLRKFKKLYPEARLIFDCVDCFTTQTRIISSGALIPKKLIYSLDSILCRWFEPRNCELADVTLVSSRREVDELRIVGASGVIQVLHHGTQLNTTTRELEISRPERTIGFHGKLTYEPNRIALHALSRIFAKVSAQGIEIEIVVCGDTNGIDRTLFPGLHFIGYKDNLADYLGTVSFGVFPVVQSVGFPNKVLESMYLGVPVLITPELARGIDGFEESRCSGVHVSNIAEFPARIIKLMSLSDETYRIMSKACRSFASEIYDGASLESQLGKLLSDDNSNAT